MDKFTKNDWQLFKSKISDWQEAYMNKLNNEYIELLSGDSSPSEKFWKLEERIKEDKKNAGVQINASRSKFIYNMVSLVNEKVIELDDLEEFSSELKETVYFILGIDKEQQQRKE